MRRSIGAIALAATLIAAAADVQAFEETKYPDWKGQWRRPAGVGNQWDTSRPPRKGAGAADAGVSGDLRGEPSGRGRRRTGYRSHL